MPHEIRQIFFSADEVVQALADYHPHQAGSLNSSGAKITLRRNGQQKVCVGFGEATIVELGLSLVSNALLSYCKSRRIPVPKDADKTISLFGEGLAITITIGSIDRIEFEGSLDGVVGVEMDVLADV